MLHAIIYNNGVLKVLAQCLAIFMLTKSANSALYLLEDYRLQPLKAKRAADWIQEGLQD